MLHIHPVAISLSLYVAHPFPRIRINPFLAGLLQDKQDDIMVGVKSTALKFGDDSKYWLSGFATVMVTGLAATGHLCDQTWPYFAGVAFVAAHLSHQVRSSRKSHPEILSSESHLIGTYPFPDVAALVDILYISCSSYSPYNCPHPIYHPHPFPKISLVFLCFFGLSLFHLVLISQVFGVFVCVQNNSLFNLAQE